MNRIPSLIFISIGCLSTTASAAASTAKPNIIGILVDDMDFSELGCYGSEIPTPNIDALASRERSKRTPFSAATVERDALF